MTARSFARRGEEIVANRELLALGLAAADQQPDPVRWCMLNVEANVEVDFTALEAMDAVREEITGRGAVFALARVKHDLLARLQACQDRSGPAEGTKDPGTGNQRP